MLAYTTRIMFSLENKASYNYNNRYFVPNNNQIGTKVKWSYKSLGCCHTQQENVL